MEGCVQLTDVASKVEWWVERALIVGYSAAELRCCKQPLLAGHPSHRVTAPHEKHIADKNYLIFAETPGWCAIAKIWQYADLTGHEREIPRLQQLPEPTHCRPFPLILIACLRNLSWVLLSCLRCGQVQLGPRFFLLFFLDNMGCGALHRLFRLTNRVPCLRNDGIGFCDVAPSSHSVAFNTHRTLILALSDSLVVETDYHARKVVGRKSCQGMLDKLLGRFLWILDLANKVNSFLVGADIPELERLVYALDSG